MFFLWHQILSFSLVSKIILKLLPQYLGCFFIACKYFIPLNILLPVHPWKHYIHSFMVCLWLCSLLCKVYLEEWQMLFCFVKSLYGGFDKMLLLPVPNTHSSSFPLLAYLCTMFVLLLLILTLGYGLQTKHLQKVCIQHKCQK